MVTAYGNAEERADRRSALIACMIANVNRDETKRPEPFTIDDFIGKPSAPKELDDDQMLNTLAMMFAKLGGTDEEGVLNGLRS